MKMLNDLIKEYMDNSLYEKRTDLCDLFKKYESDKSTWHNYSTLYKFLFEKMGFTNQPINLFELGLGTNNTSIKSNMGVSGKPGASLFAFSDYLDQAIIYAADIDKNILFQTDRIKTYY